MSVSAAVRRITPPDISAAKGGQPLVCLTAYTTPVARLADAACDVILVGDSLGMVVYGLPSTLGVTTEMMIAHGQAVMRGATRALVVVDLPFGSYEESPAQALPPPRGCWPRPAPGRSSSRAGRTWPTPSASSPPAASRSWAMSG